MISIFDTTLCKPSEDENINSITPQLHSHRFMQIYIFTLKFDNTSSIQANIISTSPLNHHSTKILTMPMTNLTLLNHSRLIKQTHRHWNYWPRCWSYPHSDEVFPSQLHWHLHQGFFARYNAWNISTISVKVMDEYICGWCWGEAFGDMREWEGQWGL